MEYIIVVLIILLFGTAYGLYSLSRDVLELSSKVRYLELLIAEVNKSIPTDEKLERMITKLIVRATRYTVEGKLDNL